MTMNLLITWQYSPERIALVQSKLTTPWSIACAAPDAPGFARALREADAVMAMGWCGNMPAAPRLRLVHLPGAGYDEVDFAAVPPDCAVCNVYEHEIGIAEYVVLGMLEWEIRLARCDTELRRGSWASGFITGAPLHGELHGKTVGFVGYGRIAHETARRLRAFGLRIMARTRTPSRCDPEVVDDAAGVERLDDMLAHCDYVVVTCPLTSATRGLIGRRQLDAMPAHAVIVNVARGEVIDEQALHDALAERRIGGAIIDTWYRYPTTGDPAEVCLPSRLPFHELDNVIMSPHCSGWSAGLLDRRWTVIAGNLDALARGEPLRNVLQAPGGPPPAD
ncbi:MAG: phosphoglycerate dehydrogenase [Chromatiales bacterium]|nr:phosphoglycerate dehydrogenase [Chromatiales bacterium]